MSKEESKHMGTKFLAMFIGFVLSTIYVVMKFFSSNFNLTIQELSMIAMVTAFFMIVWVLIMFLAEILWRYAHKYSEKFALLEKKIHCYRTALILFK